MTDSLAGKAALVSCGGSGIGRAIVVAPPLRKWGQYGITCKVINPAIE